MKRLLLCFVFLPALIAGCNLLESHQPGGEIKGTVRISNTDNAAPGQLNVSLFRLMPAHNDSITSQLTGYGGTFDFTHLDTGQYLIKSNPDLNYAKGFSVTASVTSGTPSVTVEASITPYHSLYPDTLTLPVDTIRGESTSGGVGTWLMNIKSRDSLVCQFDTSKAPIWLHLLTNKVVIPRAGVSTYNPNFWVRTDFSTFPWNPWPAPVAIPYQTQIENDTLYVSFRLVSK